MKREEAQFILSAYRPNGEDAGEPAFSEALRMVANDPILSEWFAREQAMDALVGEKLRSIAPPPDLRDRILAGGRVSRQSASYRSPTWQALAAVLMFFAVLGGYFLRPTPGDSLPQFAMNYASRGFLLEQHGHDLQKLTSWLATRGMPVPNAMPAGLAALEKLGCRTVRFHGRAVSIICFNSGDREVHLFVAKKMPTPLLASGSVPQALSAGKWSSVAWSDSENEYVLAGETDPQTLERLL